MSDKDSQGGDRTGVAAGAASRAWDHLRHLAVEIGPRGSTTPGEREAAEYAAQVFRGAGLEPKVEPFTSTVSGWRPFALAAGFAVASTLLFLATGRVAAAVMGVLMLIVTASVFMEMYFRPNPLRWFIRKGPSQNVWAEVPAARGAPAAAGKPLKAVVVAHLDTHRTPWVFTRPSRLAFFKVMTTVGVVAFVVLALAMLLYAATGWLWTGYLAFGLLPAHVIVLELTWRPDGTPFTAGANDNASGAGVLLSLAERLARDPLDNVDVLLLASGCEEVGSVGVQEFVKAHGAELRGAVGISIDNVGGEGVGVCYTRVEGMVISLKPSPRLFALAEEVRAARPDLNAYSLPYTTLHTDATCLMANGVESLSFVGLTPEGVIPNWHQASDTIERVDRGTVERNEEFVWELLRRLDAEEGGRA